MLQDLIRKKPLQTPATAIPAIPAIPDFKQAGNDLEIAAIARIAVAAPMAEVSDATVHQSDCWLVDDVVLVTTSPPMNLAEVQTMYPGRSVTAMSTEQWEAFPEVAL